MNNSIRNYNIICKKITINDKTHYVKLFKTLIKLGKRKPEKYFLNFIRIIIGLVYDVTNMKVYSKNELCTTKQ